MSIELDVLVCFVGLVFCVVEEFVVRIWESSKCGIYRFLGSYSPGGSRIHFQFLPVMLLCMLACQCHSELTLSASIKI